MSPDLLYDKKLKNIQKEIRNLKTTYFKTATTINTTTKTQSLSFSLTLEPLSGNVYSTQRAIITLTTDDNTNMISSCFLSNITPSNIDSRFIQIQRLKPSNGEVRFGIAVFSQNLNDYIDLVEGRSVNLNYTVQLVGSSNFSKSVTYKSIDGGTE